MIHDAAVLVPPPPAAPLGAMAAAALLAARGRAVALLEPSGPRDEAAEPFLLPIRSGRARSGAQSLDGLVELLVAATRLPPIEEVLEQPAVPCQLILPRHRVDLPGDPAAFATEISREWPDAAARLTALDRQLDRLDAAVAAAPARLVFGPPRRLGWAADLLACVGSPVAWLRGSSALAAPVTDLGDPTADGAMSAVAVGLGGLATPARRRGDLWRPWASARRGGRPRPGLPGIVAQLRAKALASGAARVGYDPDALRVSEGRAWLTLALDGAQASLEAHALVSGWPAAGLAPQVAGRAGARLARLAARCVPARWPARLVVRAPASALPVGLGTRAILTGEGVEPDAEPTRPLLLDVSHSPDGQAVLGLTALLDRPATDPDLAARLRARLEWLIPFLPEDAEARVLPPDPRWPARFEPARSRPIALPPLPGRRFALVGPDVAPGLGPEGELLAAVIVAGALSRRRS